MAVKLQYLKTGGVHEFSMLHITENSWMNVCLDAMWFNDWKVVMTICSSLSYDEKLRFFGEESTDGLVKLELILDPYSTETF